MSDRAVAPQPPLDEQNIVADVRRRRRALEEELSQRGLAAAILASEGNFHYFSGYRTPSWAIHSRPMFLVVRPGRSAIAVVNAAEAERVSARGVDVETAPYRDPVRVESEGEGVLEFMDAALSIVVGILAADRPRIGLELGSFFLPCLSPLGLDRLRADLAAELVDLSPLLWRLRRRKSAYEIELMRQSARALAAAFDTFRREAQAGMTERDLHRLFLTAAAASGADWVGYAVVTASVEGPILGTPGARTWTPGQLLLVDGGVLVGGYWSDFCRTFALADPTLAQASGYARLVEVVDEAREAIAPGVIVGEVAAKLQARIRTANENSFGRFGHGIGLDLTEPPSLHVDDRTALEPGMALCLEPNAHFRNAGYLVVEEMGFVTPSGYELLSPRVPAEIDVVS